MSPLSSLLMLNFYFLFFGCIGSLLLCAGFLQLWWVGATLRCSAWASHWGGFSCCRAWALGLWASIVVSHGLSICGSQALECRGLVAMQHVGPSQTRDQTHVPCIGRGTLNDCTTREVPFSCLFNIIFNIYLSVCSHITSFFCCCML